MHRDPDVIIIREIRDPSTARVLLRCALGGHLISITIHAECCSGIIKRLLKFGLCREELYHTLDTACAQRPYRKRERRKRCIYMKCRNKVSWVLTSVRNSCLSSIATFSRRFSLLFQEKLLRKREPSSISHMYNEE